MGYGCALKGVEVPRRGHRQEHQQKSWFCVCKTSYSEHIWFWTQPASPVEEYSQPHPSTRRGRRCRRRVCIRFPQQQSQPSWHPSESKPAVSCSPTNSSRSHHGNSSICGQASHHESSLSITAPFRHGSIQTATVSLFEKITFIGFIEMFEMHKTLSSIHRYLMTDSSRRVAKGRMPRVIVCNTPNIKKCNFFYWVHKKKEGLAVGNHRLQIASGRIAN